MTIEEMQLATIAQMEESNRLLDKCIAVLDRITTKK